MFMSGRAYGATLGAQPVRVRGGNWDRPDNNSAGNFFNDSPQTTLYLGNDLTANSTESSW